MTPKAAHAIVEATSAPVSEEPQDVLFRRIGEVTRALHEALRELGYDRTIASAAGTMPDTRERLAYVATLTGNAAMVVLEGVETMHVMLQTLDDGANSLDARFKTVAQTASPEVALLATDTREYFAKVRETTAASRDQLHAMMMSQDFHDLTGQVINKVVDAAHMVERSLLELLLETRTAEGHNSGRFAGPAIGHDPTGETMTSQGEVDSLLNSLGF